MERVLSENILKEESTAYTIRRRRLEQQLARRDRRWGDYLVLKVQNLASRYGQTPFRAVAASASIILLFALSYPAFGLTTAGTTITYPASISELRSATQALTTGLVYSVRTCLPFLGPGAHPATTAAQALTATESLIGKPLLGLFGLDITAQTGEGGEDEYPESHRPSPPLSVIGGNEPPYFDISDVYDANPDLRLLFSCLH